MLALASLSKTRVARNRARSGACRASRGWRTPGPLLLVMTALSVSLAACATPGGPALAGAEEARVRGEIMPLFEAMQDAANVHDAEAHLAPFVRGPSLTFVVNGRIIRGWDDLLAQQRAWWPAGRIPTADEARRPYPIVEGPEFRPLGTRHAMVTFVMDARRVYPDRVTRRPLAVSQLWEKRADGWTIVHVHESTGVERAD